MPHFNGSLSRGPLPTLGGGLSDCHGAGRPRRLQQVEAMLLVTGFTSGCPACDRPCCCLVSQNPSDAGASVTGFPTRT